MGRPTIVYDPDEFRRLWLANETCKAIAKRFGSSPIWVSQKAQQLGLPRRVTANSELPTSAIVAAYANGESQKAIVSSLRSKFPKLSRKWIRTILLSRGVTLRKTKVSKLPVAAVIRLSRAGVVDREIAARFKAGQSAVSKLIRKTLGKRHRGDGRRVRIDLAKMWRLLGDGLNMSHTARQLGCTSRAVSYHVEKRKKQQEVTA